MCEEAGHRPRIETEVKGGPYNTSHTFEYRCTVCREQLPLPEWFTKDRQKFEKGGIQTDMSILLGH